MELFAKSHADEVAGVVLVDPRHRDFLTTCEAAMLDLCGIPESTLATQAPAVIAWPAWPSRRPRSSPWCRRRRLRRAPHPAVQAALRGPAPGRGSPPRGREVPRRQCLGSSCRVPYRRPTRPAPPLPRLHRLARGAAGGRALPRGRLPGGERPRSSGKVRGGVERGGRRGRREPHQHGPLGRPRPLRLPGLDRSGPPLLSDRRADPGRSRVPHPPGREGTRLAGSVLQRGRVGRRHRVAAGGGTRLDGAGLHAPSPCRGREDPSRAGQGDHEPRARRACTRRTPGSSAPLRGSGR